MNGNIVCDWWNESDEEVLWTSGDGCCDSQMLALQAGMERNLGAQRDRQIRLHSVHTDLELDLPPSIALPDGEEIPYGSSTRLHIRDSEQVNLTNHLIYILKSAGPAIDSISNSSSSWIWSYVIRILTDRLLSWAALSLKCATFIVHPAGPAIGPTSLSSHNLI